MLILIWCSLEACMVTTKHVSWNKESCLLDASQDMLSLLLFPYFCDYICAQSKSSIKTQVKELFSYEKVLLLSGVMHQALNSIYSGGSEGKGILWEPLDARPPAKCFHVRGLMYLKACYASHPLRGTLTISQISILGLGDSAWPTDVTQMAGSVGSEISFRSFKSVLFPFCCSSCSIMATFVSQSSLLNFFLNDKAFNLHRWIFSNLTIFYHLWFRFAYIFLNKSVQLYIFSRILNFFTIW